MDYNVSFLVVSFAVYLFTYLLTHPLVDSVGHMFHIKIKKSLLFVFPTCIERNTHLLI